VNYAERVQTGRHLPRLREYLCESCRIRREVGEPGELSTWPSRLRLSKIDLDLLLVAAREFEDMSEECVTCHHHGHPGVPCPYHSDGECTCTDYQPVSLEARAVDFIDWIVPEVERETVELRKREAVREKNKAQWEARRLAEALT
jgi:hypothetical protein